MSKRFKFTPMVLAVLFLLASFTPSALGQSAQSLIQTGRGALKKQTNAGLQEAKTAFGRAVQAQPANGEAIVLEVLTTIVAEVLRPEFRQELGTLGVQVTNDNVYLPYYQYPQDEEGNYVPPQGLRSDRAKAYSDTRLSEVDRLLGLLQRITEQNFSTINLSAEETGLKAVRIDFMDVRMLRVIGHLFKASLAGANGYDTSLEYHLLYRAVVEELTLQQFLADVPDLFQFATGAQRSEAREQLRLANVEFQAAVQFYFGQRQDSSLTPFLFDFDHAQQASESAEIAQFLANALYGPQIVPLDGSEAGSPLLGKAINFAPLFTSGTPLRSLLPTRYDRGFFRRDSWPSATFGGVLGSPDPDLLNEIGAGLGLLQGALYEPYDFTFVAGSDVPPTWNWSNDGQSYRPFTEITSIAADSRGNVFLADAGLNVIRKLAPDGKMIVVAGQEWVTWAQRDELLARSAPLHHYGYRPSWPSSPSTAVLERPRALAIDRYDNLFFASGGRVYRLAADGTMSALAGQDGWFNPSDYADGVGGAARFGYIYSMAADRAGNVLVVDGGTSIRKITPQGVVSTLAGSPGVYGYQDGPGAQSLFNWLEGVVVDSRGAIYAADSGNGVIRKIDAAGNVSTYVGTPLSQIHFDAAVGKARLGNPMAIAIDAADNIYFVDNTTIRKVSAGGSVVTIAGKPWSSDAERLGVGENARFSEWPYKFQSLAAAPGGKLYAANYRSIIVGMPVSAALADEGGGNVSHPVPGSVGPPWPDVPAANPPTGSGNLQSLALGKTSVTLNGQEDMLEVTGAFSGILTNVQITFAHQQTGGSVTGWANLDHPTAPRNISGSMAVSLPLRLPA